MKVVIILLAVCFSGLSSFAFETLVCEGATDLSLTRQTLPTKGEVAFSSAESGQFSFVTQAGQFRGSFANGQFSTDPDMLFHLAGTIQITGTHIEMAGASPHHSVNFKLVLDCQASPNL